MGSVGSQPEHLTKAPGESSFIGMSSWSISSLTYWDLKISCKTSKQVITLLKHLRAYGGCLGS